MPFVPQLRYNIFMISIIAAIGKNNELGKANKLLWDLPADMKYFREKTAGRTVIMGRKTFESIGYPLPKRRNIVITRGPNYDKDGIETTSSLENALKLFPKKEKGSKGKDEEIFIIGGAEVYKQAIDIVDKLYITHVDEMFTDADTYFPEITPDVWKEVAREKHNPDPENKIGYTFSVYEKVIKSV